MKFNKMKLAALAMSALMAASTVSPAVYAADLFSDGAEEVFISEETEPAAEQVPIMGADPVTGTGEVSPADNAAPAAETEYDKADGYGYEVGNVKYRITFDETFYEKDPDTTEVEITCRIFNDKGEQIKDTAGNPAVYKGMAKVLTIDPECEKTGYVMLQHKFPETGSADDEWSVVVKYLAALTHQYNETGNRRIGQYPTHDAPGYYEYEKKCSLCGKTIWEKKPGDPSVELEHVWQEEVTYWVPAGSGANVELTGNKLLAAEYVDANGILQNVDLWEIKMKDGSPVISGSPTKGFYYYAVRKCVFFSTDKAIDVVKKEFIATQGDRFEVHLVTDGNIKAMQGNKTAEEYIADLIRQGKYDETLVELEDCGKDGKYELWFYTDWQEEDYPPEIAGPKVYERTVKAHHHLQKYIQFNSEDDFDRCTVSAAGNVTNNYCLPVDYTVVYWCDCDKCKLTAQTVKKVGLPGAADLTNLFGVHVDRTEAGHKDGNKNHIINTAVEKAVNKLAETAKVPLKYKEELVPTIVETVYGAGTDKKLKDVKDVIVEPGTATCTEGGTVLVKYICNLCGNVIREKSVNVQALGHDETGYKVENFVEPKCDKIGSYDYVNKCERCGKIIDSRHFTLNKTPHENAVASLSNKNLYVELVAGQVIVDGGKDDSLKLASTSDGNKKYGYPPYTVTANLYSLCDYCKGNKTSLNSLTNDYLTGNNRLQIIVNSVTKEGKDCKAGAITLTAKFIKDANGKSPKVYTSDQKTYDYYSSETAYAGRTAHTWEIIREEIVKEATGTAAGLKKVTSRCKVCGTEKTEDVEIPALGVQPVKPATPSVSAASAGYNSINVSWSAVDKASGYRLYYRSAGTGVNRWKFIRVVNGTSFRHTGLVTGEAYRYTVKAVVNGVQSDYSKTGAVARPMPAAPVIRSVTAVSAGTKVTWSKVAGADGYIIQRKTVSGSWTRVATVKSGTKVTWTDKNAVSGASYRVRAYCTANNKNYKGDFSAAK